jgi:serine/threonine protein kinase
MNDNNSIFIGIKSIWHNAYAKMKFDVPLYLRTLTKMIIHYHFNSVLARKKLNKNTNNHDTKDIFTAELLCDCFFCTCYDNRNDNDTNDINDHYDDNDDNEFINPLQLHMMCHKRAIMIVRTALCRVSCDNVFLRNLSETFEISETSETSGISDMTEKVLSKVIIGKNKDDQYFIVGDILNNRYKIIKICQTGSSGLILFGHDMRLNKNVIIKISSANEESKLFLLKEYNTLVNLHDYKKTNYPVDQRLPSVDQRLPSDDHKLPSDDHKLPLADNDIAFPEIFDIFSIESLPWASSKTHIVLVMKQYSDDLFEYVLSEKANKIRKARKTTNKQPMFTLKNIQTLFRQLAKTVMVIHELNLIHKDIKCENILIRNKTHMSNSSESTDIDVISNDYEFILIDYGLAMNTYDNDLHYNIFGTRSYLTPEELIGSGYNKSVDIFAIALVVIEMCRERYVFSGNIYSMLNAYKQIYPSMPDTYNVTIMTKCAYEKSKKDFENVHCDDHKTKYTTDYFVHGICDEDLIDLIKQCTNYDITKRITAREIINHPFIVKQIDQGLFAINQRLPTVDQRLPTVDQRLPTVDQRLPTVDQRLPTVDT